MELQPTWPFSQGHHPDGVPRKMSPGKRFCFLGKGAHGPGEASARGRRPWGLRSRSSSARTLPM